MEDNFENEGAIEKNQVLESELYMESEIKEEIIDSAVSMRDSEWFSCDHCDYKNPMKRNLTHHILSTHEGIRFECNDCSLQFKDKTNLRRHIRTVHEGVRYECDQCEYKATQKSSLRIHKESTHEGVKYTCDICGFMASRPSNLTAHMKWKHSDKVFYCDQCDFDTKLRSRLTAHYKKSHDLSFLTLEIRDGQKQGTKSKITVTNNELTRVLGKIFYEANSSMKTKDDNEINVDIPEDNVSNDDFPDDNVSDDDAPDNNLPNDDVQDEDECDNNDFSDEEDSYMQIEAEDDNGNKLNVSLEDKTDVTQKCEVEFKFECESGEDEKIDPKLEVQETVEEKYVYCDQCDYKSPKGWNVRIHKQTVHDGIKFQCKYENCTYQTTRKYELKKHLKVLHKEDVTFPCDICNTEFVHEFKLKIHRREEHNINKSEKKLKCKKAESVPRLENMTKKTGTVLGLKNKPTSTKKIRTCYFCEFTCFHPSDMKNHRESTHAGEKYHCTQCNFSAGLRKNLNAHIRSKHEFGDGNDIKVKVKKPRKPKLNLKKEENESESLLCDQCEFQARDTNEMKVHMKTHENTVELFCPECSYSTFKKKLLRGHIYVKHQCKDRFLCDECSFTTNTNKSMRRHKESGHLSGKFPPHTPAEPIYCDQCDYKTTVSRNLKAHILVEHMGVRYPCDQCGFQARDKSSLKRHQVSIHQGVRHACDQCDYVATQTSSLKSHKESKHQGIKYQCDECNYMASRQDNLNIHKKIKHKNEVFYCEHCEFHTKVHTRLKTHLKKIHCAINFDNK